MKRARKTKFFIAITAVCLAAFIAAITVMFAWMTNSATIYKAGFKINQISCRIEMYRALDSNFNGVPDLLGEGLGKNGAATSSEETTTTKYGKYLKSGVTVGSDSTDNWADYSSLYYTEKYSFQFWESRYMTSNEATANTFATVTLKDVEPSRVYTCKFSITNQASSGGNLSFAFEKYTAETTSTGGTTENNGDTSGTNNSTTTTTTTTDVSAFECRMFVVKKGTDGTGSYTKYTTTTGEGESAVKTEWFDFNTEGTHLQSNVAIAGNKTNSTGDTTGGTTGDTTGGTTGDTTTDNQVDIWLQIRMKSATENTETKGTDDTSDDTTYLSTSEKKVTVTFPAFRITFANGSSSGSGNTSNGSSSSSGGTSENSGT